MYARLVRFKLGTGAAGVAKALASELAPKIAGQPGCGDYADGEYGIFVLWDSQAHAEAAATIIRPILDGHLSGHVQAPPEARLYEVISGSPASPAP
jgi:hypothetical protein